MKIDAHPGTTIVVFLLVVLVMILLLSELDNRYRFTETAAAPISCEDAKGLLEDQIEVVQICHNAENCFVTTRDVRQTIERWDVAQEACKE